MLEKLKRLETVLHTIDPNMELQVEDRDGGKLVYGPFPSFLIHLTETEDRYLIHVNADAPNLVYYMAAILKEFPDMIHDGAFAVDSASSMLVLGQDAYLKKEDNILTLAKSILDGRNKEKQESLYVPENKIIVAK